MNTKFLEWKNNKITKLEVCRTLRSGIQAHIRKAENLKTCKLRIQLGKFESE